MHAHLREELKYLLSSIANVHRPGAERNVLLCATPRSGSTWLMEIIASQPGFKFYDEPLNIRRSNVKRAGWFTDWDFSVYGGGGDQRVVDFLRRLVSNEFRFMNPVPFRRHHRFLTSRIVFKIHEVEHMINTLKNALRADVLFLVRHPVATTVSRHELPRLEVFLRSGQFAERFLDLRQRELAERIYARGSDFERGILAWCCQSLVPLRTLDREDWTVVTYEELVINPSRSAMLLSERFRLPDATGMLRQFQVPAVNIGISDAGAQAAVTEPDEMRRRATIVSKWKKRVKEGEERVAFEIQEAFGLDVYERGSLLARKEYLHFSDTRELLGQCLACIG